jgi:HK97 family phage major capsid protein
MDKELREILAKIETIKAEARQLLSEDKVTEAEAKAAEARELQKKADLMKEMGDNTQDRGKKLGDEKDEAAEYRKVFCKALRGKVLTAEERELLEKRTMTEGVAADGGLVVPQDIQTTINQYKRALPDLSTLVNIIPVGTLSGSRVFEKIATMTPLANISEAADISDMGSPQFETVTYSVKKYAGILPISNELLNDSDQNLLSYIAQWIARKSVVTRNSLITTLLNTLSKVTMADWKAMKKALNITLDPMLAAGAVIVTNQDGFQYLDTLTDGQNRPLIKPDVTEPSGNVLFGKRLITVPNGTLATTGTTTKLAPMIIGNLLELIIMFERQGYQIASTNVGGGSFVSDTTHVRVIEREDIQLIDDAAAVYGQIDVTSVV